jgi:hypothetical protein
VSEIAAARPTDSLAPSRGRLDRVLVAIAVGMLAGLAVFMVISDVRPGDAYTYLGAGERLNAGHPLYALTAGDRSIPMMSEGDRYPILSPPLIAVVWRPLAALPATLGIWLWWAATIATLAAICAALLVRTPRAAALALIVLSIPIVYEAVTGNVNPLLIAAALGVWVLGRRGSWEAAAFLAVTMVAIKLTPLPILAWALAVGGRRSFVGGLVGLPVWLVVGLVGAGPGAHFDYLAVTLNTAGTPLGANYKSGLATILNLPPPAFVWATRLLGVGGLVAVVLLRHRPAVAWAVAVLAWTFFSPAIYVNTLALLLAALAPLAWPWPEREAPATGASTEP